MITANLFNKSDLNWATGKWQSEPDMAAWVHHQSGYICMIRRNLAFRGGLCAYVGIPTSNPLYGLDHTEIPEEIEIEVHGGISYGCHIEDFESLQNLYRLLQDSWVQLNRKLSPYQTPEWIIGFDCHHGQYHDYGPYYPFSPLPDLFPENPENYKDFNYVVGETNKLAEQLYNLAQGTNPQ